MPRQQDAHLVNFFKAKFNLTIEESIFSYEWICYEGEYDLDMKTASGYNVFDAAHTYAQWYDGEMADIFDTIEDGSYCVKEQEEMYV